MDTAPFRAGHVAVIGRPNVGKSTLVNALVGAKISITSNRPQTTRHRLLGIATFPAGQLLLVDTPGIHREQKRAMNRMMNRAARGALEGVDASMLVVQAGLYFFGEGLWPLALWLTLFFVAFNILEASVPSLVSRTAPPAAKGAALGVYNTTQAVGMAIGGMVGGYIAQHFGDNAVFSACAGMA